MPFVAITVFLTSGILLYSPTRHLSHGVLQLDDKDKIDTNTIYSERLLDWASHKTSIRDPVRASGISEVGITYWTKDTFTYHVSKFLQ
jgi:hypothetical protein